MIANLNDYLKDLMVYIPEGEILLRDFRNEQKWISSNYKKEIGKSSFTLS